MSNKNRRLAPCDCKDREDTKLLEEQGIGKNEISLTVLPAYVEIKNDHTTMKMSMSDFKMMAEWYLKPQIIKQ